MISELVLWSIIIFLYFILLIRPYLLARKKFTCLRCGECCQLRVKLSEEEIERIKKEGYSDFVDRHGYIKLKEKSCQFLNFKNGKTLCSIEHIKPSVCKKFPARKGLFGIKRDIRCKTCIRKMI